MFNYTFVLDFLKHRFKAKTRHGVHSPFVYNLVDKVIYDFAPKSDYKNIEDLRNYLSVDDRFIGKKQISQITNREQKPKKLAQLIYRLVQYHQPKNVLEIGASLGILTSYMALANPNAIITAIEKNEELANIAKENFDKLKISNINVIVGDFKSLLPQILKEDKLDFVFINGISSKEEMLNYFNYCMPNISSSSLLIFDDIYKNEETKAAWEEIKSRPEVTVTIDLFWIGLVYFRSGIAKEHFKIKF